MTLRWTDETPCTAPRSKKPSVSARAPAPASRGSAIAVRRASCARAGALAILALAVGFGLHDGGHLKYPGSPWENASGRIASLFGFAADGIKITGLKYHDAEVGADADRCAPRRFADRLRRGKRPQAAGEHGLGAIGQSHADVSQSARDLRRRARAFCASGSAAAAIMSSTRPARR